MNTPTVFTQPHIRAKILGTILIITGITLLFTQTDIGIKIAFTAILIGLFIIFMITEKTIPTNISNAHIKGSLQSIRNIITELNLQGNSIYLPTSHILTEERTFIPLTSTQNTKIPEIDNDLVFATGTDGKSLGISVPPAGLQLLNEIDTEHTFEHTTLDTIEEHLQTFVGHNLLKKITLTKQQNTWKLDLEKPLFCTKNTTLCKQYPCPTCSAILTAITRAGNQKIHITDAENNGTKTTFYFKTEE